MGIVEVVINIIVAEMAKADNGQKSELERELSQFIDIHESVEKYTLNSRWGNGTKKALIQPSLSDTADKVASGANKSQAERTPLLATSSIHCLLQLALELWKFDYSKVSANSQKKQPTFVRKDASVEFYHSFPRFTYVLWSTKILLLYG